MSSRFQGRMREAYNAMSERVLHLMQSDAHGVSQGEVRQSLESAMLQAREWVMTAKELTHEEADDLAATLRHEVDELSNTLVAAEEEFEDWVETDLLFAEHRAVECMLLAADPTTRDLMRLKEMWGSRWRNFCGRAIRWQRGRMNASIAVRCCIWMPSKACCRLVLHVLEASIGGCVRRSCSARFPKQKYPIRSITRSAMRRR